MSYPVSDKLMLPVEQYEVSGYSFKEKVRRKVVLWATHLGDDVTVAAGSEVEAIGDGEVVWSEMRLGSEQKRNWGGIVVLAHGCNFQSSIFNFQTFYSVYGHLRDLQVEVGDRVVAGQKIGEVAGSYTPENGWWKIPHLHFAVYVGPWREGILPGYKRVEEFRTKVKWWRDPRSFISEYNKS